MTINITLLTKMRVTFLITMIIDYKKNSTSSANNLCTM